MYFPIDVVDRMLWLLRPFSGVKSDRLLGILPKRRNLASVGVVAFLDSLSVLKGRPTGPPQGNCWVATQPQAGVAAVDADSLGPSLGESTLNLDCFDQQASNSVAARTLKRFYLPLAIFPIALISPVARLAAEREM